MILSRKERFFIPVVGRGRGFTLVELLVTIGVISILVGIVSTPLVRIREQAHVVNCQASLRGLTAAIPMYAICNGGWLPPGPIERSYWAGDPDRGSPIEPYDSRRIDDPSLSSQEGWYGLGLLWKGGYVDNGRVYYCPSATDSGGIGYNQGWPRAFDNNRNPADGKTRVFSTYAYRGGLSSHAGKPNGPLNVNRNPGTLAVFADNPCSGKMWHEGLYNVAFLDGHIESCAFDKPVVPAGHLQDLWQAIGAWEE
ncbi:MAG: type II secretion system protein [Planctomycetota bacterium]|nr:type II secretion system protein [Planctomycetota bacterium]